MTKADAEQIIPQHELDLYVEWIRGAVREYVQEYPAHHRLIHSKGARAHVIQCHIINRVARGFEAIRGARFIDKRGRKMLIVADSHIDTFKKLDKSRRPRYIRTNQAIRYAGQLPLISVPEPTHLILGYQFNDLATDCSSIFIICMDGDHNAWEWEIWTSEPQMLPVFPTIEQPMPSTGRGRLRVRSKPSAMVEDDESKA